MAADGVTAKSGRSLSLLLAFLSGFVDTAVFVHMGGLFVAHVTGNFVLLGATVARTPVAGHGDAVTLQLIAFPLFFVAAMLAAALSARVAEARRTRLLLWLTTGIIALAGALALAGLAADSVLAMALVVAMGLLNAAQRLDAGLGPPFTVMTGNVTSVAIEAAYRLHLAPRSDAKPASAGAATMLWLVVSFGVGCALGALTQSWVGLGAMVAPAALLGLRLAWRG